MIVGLMHPGHDVDLALPLPPHARDLRTDLRLDRLLDVAAGSDVRVRAVMAHAMLTPLTRAGDVEHRQQVLADVLADPHLVTSLHAVATETLDAVERLPLSWLSPEHPSAALKRSVEVMRIMTGAGRRLHTLATTEQQRARSPGLHRLLESCRHVFEHQYLDEVDHHLDLLAFRDGLRLHATLGPGARVCVAGVQRPQSRGTWWHDLVAHHDGSGSIAVAAHDEPARRAWAGIHDSGLAPVVEVLDNAVDQTTTFVRTLAVETGFYLGAAALCTALSTRGTPLTLPALREDGTGLRATGLRDAHMVLGDAGPVVGNDIDASRTPLVVVTGANGGGKSTLLRSIGLAQLMGQAGLPVAAEQMDLELRPGVFTHVARDEDPSLQRGRLDDELTRMDAIVDVCPPRCLLLVNEAFASTYEREGAQIAADIVRALLACGARVVYVTHQYDLARALLDIDPDAALSLRAGRAADGGRTYRLHPAPPRPTSHADDVWAKVFGG